MDHQQMDIAGIELKLRKQAVAFLTTTKQAKFQNYNSESILVRLTGRRFGEIVSSEQICSAKASIESALLSERKKARLKRYDYDLNRHIALHQAMKSLASKTQKLNAVG